MAAFIPATPLSLPLSSALSPTPSSSSVSRSAPPLVVAPPAAAARPLHDRVLVRPDKPSDRTDAGLILAQPPSDHKQRTGTVVAVAPGRYSPEGLRETDVVGMLHPGDKVLWKDQYGSETLTPPDGDGDGEQLVALRAFSIVAKFAPTE